MNHKIITSAGFGNSGSSAATNFFEEFSNVKCIGSSLFECTFIHEPDGLIDLANAFFEGHRLKVDLAIKRFIALSEKLQADTYRSFFNGQFLNITLEYLTNLNLIIWNGGWHRSGEFTDKSYKTKLRKKAALVSYENLAKKASYNLYEADTWRPHYVPFEKQNYKNIPLADKNAVKHFISLTKKYLNTLFDSCDPENEYEYLLFDQLLPPNADERYTMYFDNVKVIVIDRDPRDLYFGNKVFWGNRFFPSDTPENFCNWYLQTRYCKNYNNPNVMHLMIEDFIFNYEITCSRLYAFTGLKAKKHKKKLSILQPKKSEINTRLWLKYTFSNEQIKNKFNSEISYIEKRLKKYCFNEYSFNITESPKEVNFIMENAVLESDRFVLLDKLSLKNKISFLVNSLYHDFHDINLIKTVNWSKTIRINTLKKKILFFIKMFLYILFLPFEIIYLFIKNIIDLFII